jgi:hypothetical protein
MELGAATHGRLHVLVGEGLPLRSEAAPITDPTTSLPVTATQIVVSPAGIPWVIAGTDDILYQGNSIASAWMATLTSDSTVSMGCSLTAGVEGTAWMIGTDGNIWYMPGSGATWVAQTNPASLTQLSVSANGTLFGANEEGEVYELPCADGGLPACYPPDTG